MTRRRTFMTMAALAALVLTGCDRIQRATNSTYSDGIRCMEGSLSADAKWVVVSTMGDPSGIRTDQQTLLRRLSDGHTYKLAGRPSGSAVQGGAVSADGGVAVFEISYSIDGGLGAENRVFAYSRATGKRTQISPTGESELSSAVSGDGRYVAYASEAGAIWRYDRTTKTRSRMSQSSTIARYVRPALSADGRYVTYFRSDNPGIYVHDAHTGYTFSLLSAGETAENLTQPSISSDGRYVAYTKEHPGLLSGASEIYVWDKTTGTSKRLTSSSVDKHVGQATISGDGSRVAFSSLVPGKYENTLTVADRATGKATTVVRPNHYLHNPVMSGSGHHVEFCTDATNLAPNSPQAPNIYVWSDGAG
jgi:Tol biopolymer transport system component